MNLHNDFIERHIGPSKNDTTNMLQELNMNSLDELIKKTIPKNIKLNHDLNLPQSMSEPRYLEHIKKLGEKNKNYRSYIGLGYYNTVLPSVIQRNILENPNWYTAYTPYQPEISQGRLEALFNFQTVITDLTGMDLANGSLLDEATAAAEAMILSHNFRSSDKKKQGANTFLVCENCLPQTIAVLKTRASSLNINLIIQNHRDFNFSNDVFGFIVQYPNKNGTIYDYKKLILESKEKDIISTVAADLLSLAILRPPGEFGADIAVGSSQRFGIPMGYGGPHAAYFATKEKYKRGIPGRIIGISKDVDGNKAYRMALQTREQHIRREKATSNICTSQVLLAIMASMYAVFHGPNRLKKIAKRIHDHTQILCKQLVKLEYKQLNSNFFDTLLIDIEDMSMDDIKLYAQDAKMNFYFINENLLSISLDEKDDIQNVYDIILVFAKAKNKTLNKETIENILNQKHYEEIETIKKEHLRSSKFLQYDIFNSFHTETELMRYIKSLEKKDLSLTHSMIPLGSCTMKLNAAVQLLPLSWSEFSNMHPFAPLNQARGYQIMFHELEEALCEITGFDAISLQPNSGAQGEYAGLMVIKEFHKKNGNDD